MSCRAIARRPRRRRSASGAVSITRSFSVVGATGTRCASMKKARRRIPAGVSESYRPARDTDRLVTLHPVSQKGAHIAVYGAPGRKGWRWWQMPPLAAGAHEVEEAIQQVSHVRGPRPSTGPGGRDERL